MDEEYKNCHCHKFRLDNEKESSIATVLYIETLTTFPFARSVNQSSVTQ